MITKTACAGLTSCALLGISMSAHAAGGHGHHHHTAAQTDGLAITGRLDSQAGYVDQDLTRGSPRELRFLNDTEIHFTYQGTTEGGLRYGAVVEMEADVTADFKDEGLNADKTYLFFESNLGRVEMGSTGDAAHHLGVGPSRFARATGGIHGDWFYHALFPGTMGGGHGHSMAHIGHSDFLHFPTLPLHHMHSAAEDATKLSYYTPAWNGWRVGISYIPDSGTVGTAAGFSGKTGHRDFNDVFNGGISYTGSFGPVGFQASLTGEGGRAEVPGHENLAAWVAGFTANYAGFNIGADYGDWGESVTHSSPTNSDGDFYSLGVGYDWQRAGISLTWFESTYQRNDTQILSLGADYLLAPGLVPYVEVTQVDFDHADPAIQDNDATVVLSGVEISF